MGTSHKPNWGDNQGRGCPAPAMVLPGDTLARAGPARSLSSLSPLSPRPQPDVPMLGEPQALSRVGGPRGLCLGLEMVRTPRAVTLARFPNPAASWAETARAGSHLSVCWVESPRDFTAQEKPLPRSVLRGSRGSCGVCAAGTTSRNVTGSSDTATRLPEAREPPLARGLGQGHGQGAQSL